MFHKKPTTAKRKDARELLLESILTSISINGFYVKSASLQSYIGNYCLNLFAWNNDPTFKLSMYGSATPIYYKGHYFLICTKHQLKQVNPEMVSIISNDGELALSSSGMTFHNISTADHTHDIQDIVLFNFDDACRDKVSLQKHFFRINGQPIDSLSTDVIAFQNLGFPSQDQIYDLAENNHIGSRRRTTTLLLHRQPLDDSLLHLKPTQPLSFDPDGLSGGPNFVIQKVRSHFELFFAGVTVRAGHDDFFIVKSGYIMQFMDAAINLRN